MDIKIHTQPISSKHAFAFYRGANSVLTPLAFWLMLFSKQALIVFTGPFIKGLFSITIVVN